MNEKEKKYIDLQSDIQIKTIPQNLNDSRIIQLEELINEKLHILKKKIFKIFKHNSKTL